MRRGDDGPFLGRTPTMAQTYIFFRLAMLTENHQVVAYVQEPLRPNTLMNVMVGVFTAALPVCVTFLDQLVYTPKGFLRRSVFDEFGAQANFIVEPVIWVLTCIKSDLEVIETFSVCAVREFHP